MDYQLDGEIQLVVYNKQSEYAESNLGLGDGDQYNTGGVNRIVGRKIILYFEGDHAKLDEQIKLGLAQIMFQGMMYGGGITSVIRSSALMNIPPWFEQGFIEWMGRGWNPEIDNHVRDGVLSGRYKKFSHLTGLDATYAGLSVWNYIAQTYGETVIPNILYLTRTSRSIESAFLFVLGTSLKALTADWYNYYNQQYKKDNIAESMPKGTPLLKKPKKTRVYYHLKTSPDGRYVVYTTNQMGKDKVWLYDLQTQKKKVILTQGHKINRVLDYSYPLVAWHPSGELFSLINEKEGKLLLYTYTLADHKLQWRRIVNFEKILDFSYADDGTKFVMSAVQDGQTDIFVFTAGSNGYEQITKDVYDDMNPRFIDHSTKIIFSSNRPDDSLRLGGDYHKMQKHSDIFIYNYATHSNQLRRITNTPDVDETEPDGYSGNYVSYLSNATGIINRYLAYVDSTISFVDTSSHYRYIVHSYPVTDYTRNILEQDAPLSLKNYTQVMLYKGRYWMYQDTLPSSPTATIPVQPRSTAYMSHFLADQKKRRYDDSLAKVVKNDTNSIVIKYPTTTIIPPVVKVNPADTAKSKATKDTTHINPANKPVDINDYSFDQNQLNKAAGNTISFNAPPNITHTADTTHKDTLKRKRTLERENYHVSFSTDFVLTQLDNSFLNASYQPYTGGPYQDPGIDGFLKVGLSDLFEDYKIDGGVRLSLDFNSNEYYLSFRDLSHRLDKQLILHRDAELNVTSPINGDLTKIYTHEATYILSWPFSEVARVQGSLGVRNDKTIYLAQDQPSLEQPNGDALWTHGELDYVFDATRPLELNINYGFKAKIFAQYYNNVLQHNSNMYILGVDARYYQEISRDLIWAVRFSASTSFGQEELLYYMGGVDGWFNPQFNSNITPSSSENFAFQTVAVPLRGFDQNIRDGNSFALLNNEIRWPIFHYLFNRPLKSDFLNNFQIIGFFDVGTAWAGPNPYSSQNALNTVVVSAPGNPITVILSTQQNPYVEGFGGGVRSRLLGYFIRFDEAWGISNGAISTTPISYLSLSLDF